MENKEPEFDVNQLEMMNQKAIQNQFFVPDNIYMDLGLFKDFSLGAIFADLIYQKEDEAMFKAVQKRLSYCVKEYQNRQFDTVEPFFNELGYTDKEVDALLDNKDIHEPIFLLSPNTKFIPFLLNHIVKNQNHSKPANRYTKKKIDSDLYTLEAIEVTFRINTYPLTLSPEFLTKVASQLGEDFGVNIVFMNKDPSTFDSKDWEEWLGAIDCFYLDSLGKFTKSPICIEKQTNMQMTSKYVFSRKRFERAVLQIVSELDIDHQIQLVTSYQSVMCDFSWIQFKDLRLTDEPDDVPMMDDDKTDMMSKST